MVVIQNTFHRNHQGFSLIELMLSISIVMVIVVVGFTNFRKSEQTSVLEGEGERLSASMKEAEIKALAGEFVEGTQVRPPYGIYIALPDEYYLFGDTLPAGNPDFIYTGGDTIVRRMKTAPTVQLSGVGTSYVFSPPLVEVYVNGTKGVSGTITLSHVLTGSSIQVSINGISGQVNMK